MIGCLPRYVVAFAMVSLVVVHAGGAPGAIAQTAVTVQAHPRTAFDAAELAQLQASHAPEREALATVLKAAMDQYAADPSVASHDLVEIFPRGIAGYAITARIFADDPAYVTLARQALVNMNSGPRDHDLDQADYLCNLALAYDVLYPLLGETERTIYRGWLADAADDMARAAQTGAFWTDDLVQNHNWVNFAAIGLAGFVLQGEDARADSWVALAIANSERVKAVQDLAADGSWHEGIGYLEFGLSGSIPYWLAARRAGYLPDDSALLRNLGRYILAAQLPGNPRVHIMTHGDWNWSRPNLPEVLQYAATRYRDSFAQEAVRRWEADTTPSTQRQPGGSALMAGGSMLLAAALEYIMLDPTIPPLDPAALDLDFFAADQQAAIVRSGWDPAALVLAFKNGVLGGRGNYDRIKTQGQQPAAFPGGFLNFGHDHMDDLSLHLYGNGGWYLTDVPGYNCCTPGSTDAYSTEFANSFLIGASGQYGDRRNRLVQDRVPHNALAHPWFFDREASVPLHTSTAHYAFVRGDGTRLYPPETTLRNLERTVVLVRDGYAVVQDQIDLGAALPVDQLFHFQLSAATEGPWIQGVNALDHVLGVRVLSPTALDVTITMQHSNKCATLTPMCVEDPNTHVQSATYAEVKVRPSVTQLHTTLLELLWPTDSGGWVNRPDARSLNPTDPGGGLVLPLSDGRERWLFSGGTGEDLLLVGGDIGIARTDASGAFRRLVLLAPGALVDRGGARRLLASPNASAVEIAFSAGGTVAELSGAQLDRIQFYGPDVRRVLIDGQDAGGWSRDDTTGEVSITGGPP